MPKCKQALSNFAPDAVLIEMIPQLICLHRCRCDWCEKNHTHRLDSDELLLTNYFLLAVNRNEAIFLQAWLTTHQEACLPDLFVCLCVCVFGWGVALHKPDKHTPPSSFHSTF